MAPYYYTQLAKLSLLNFNIPGPLSKTMKTVNVKPRVKHCARETNEKRRLGTKIREISFPVNIRTRAHRAGEASEYSAVCSSVRESWVLRGGYSVITG